MKYAIKILLIVSCTNFCLANAKIEKETIINYLDSLESNLEHVAKNQSLGELQISAYLMKDTLSYFTDIDKSCYLSSVYMYLGLSNYELKPELSKVYHNQSITYSDQCDNPNQKAKAYNRYAIFYAYHKQVDSALFFFRKAYDICEEFSAKKYWYNININLARASIYINDIKSYKKHLDIALKDALLKNDSSNIAHAYELIGFYNKDKNPEKAEKNFELFYQWSIKEANPTYFYALQEIIEFYKKRENYKKVAFYYDELFRVKRFEQEVTYNKRFDNLAQEFEIQESKNKLANLELQNKLIQQNADAQKKWNRLFLVFSIVLLMGLIFYFRNFKKQQQLGEDLNRKNDQLLEAKKNALDLAAAKTQFSATISHELRTPLHGIIGLSSLLISQEKKTISQEGKGYLGKLKLSAEYLLRLINDVLEISKIDNQALKIESRSFNFEHFISNINNTFDKVKLESHNKLEINIDQDIPLFLKGDPIRLSQILINLLSNALKFTRNGKVVLNAELLKKENERLTILFEVIDNGPGIPKFKQKEIFDKFIQLREPSSNSSGTGLGLPIVKEILALLGSEIQLKSTLGKGSVFYFELDFELGKEEYASELEDETTLNNYGFENSQILIVDDNQVNLIVSQKILEQVGYDVTTCLSGEQAIECVNEKKYDLILMDLQMPKMDGVETTEIIKASHPNIPIIMVTASNVTENWDQYAQHGFEDFIIKPFNKFEFLEKILNYLKQEKNIS
jgi:signal transduction histidine kinase/CheY-like chemotaxis protein